MSENFSAYREFFPVTRTDIYMNHAAISPLSTQVVSALDHALAERSNGPVDTFEKMLDEKKKLKHNIASLQGIIKHAGKSRGILGVMFLVPVVHPDVPVPFFSRHGGHGPDRPGWAPVG